VEYSDDELSKVSPPFNRKNGNGSVISIESFGDRSAIRSSGSQKSDELRQSRSRRWRDN